MERDQRRKRRIGYVDRRSKRSQQHHGRGGYIEAVMRHASGPSACRPEASCSFRASSGQERSHNDVPIAELSGLALPYVRISVDDEQVLRKMAEYFGLGRLREATRARFYQAVMLAKSVQA